MELWDTCIATIYIAEMSIELWDMFMETIYLAADALNSFIESAKKLGDSMSNVILKLNNK